MKSVLQIILLVAVLFALAIFCFQASAFVMTGFDDCRYSDYISFTTPCADDGRLALGDFFGYGGIILFALSLFLPILIYFRNQPVQQTKLLD